MYIRNTTFSYEPANEEAVIQLSDAQLFPLLRKLPGFVSYHAGLDRSGSRGIAISVWDNMDHAAGLRAAMGGLVQQFEAIGIRFDPAQVYELIRQV